MVIFGGIVFVDVWVILYIGIFLVMVVILIKGLDLFGGFVVDLVKLVGILVGMIGMVLFYFVVVLNLVW